jgi:hypothetical protein
VSLVPEPTSVAFIRISALGLLAAAGAEAHAEALEHRADRHTRSQPPPADHSASGVVDVAPRP